MFKLKPEIKLYPYQVEGASLIKRNLNFTIADEMGLGKTIQALAGICDDTDVNQVLIICPKTLINTWIEWGIKNFIDNVTDKDIKIIAKGSQAEIADELPPYKFTLTTYELLRKFPEENYFERFNAVIADEAHKLKSLYSENVAQMCIAYYKNIARCSSIKYKIFLTGTPIYNRVPDLYSIVELARLSPSRTKEELEAWDLVASPHYKFLNNFCYKTDVVVKSWRTPFGKKYLTKPVYDGLKNKELLDKFLGKALIRRTWKDIESTIKLPDQVRAPIICSYKEDNALKIAWDSYCRTGVIDQTIKTKSARAKALFTANYVLAMNEDSEEQIIVYSDHVEAAMIIAETLGTIAIHGQVSREKRDKLVSTFFEGKKVSNGLRTPMQKYLVATIGAASTGLNLMNASTMVFNDLSYTPSNNDQAEARIYRHGQTEKCKYYYVIGSRSDAHISAILTDKKATIGKVFAR